MRRDKGLQCLSAFVRFGTDAGVAATRVAAAGLQCLSAFVRFGTPPRRPSRVATWPVSNAFRHSSVSGRLPARREGVTLIVRSPMPFGIRPFRDPPRRVRGHSDLLGSPMPFGIRPFRDDRERTGQIGMSMRLQCLSAFVRFGTSPSIQEFHEKIVSPMPFGIRPFRDAGIHYGCRARP